MVWWVLTGVGGTYCLTGELTDSALEARTEGSVSAVA